MLAKVPGTSYRTLLVNSYTSDSQNMLTHLKGRKSVVQHSRQILGLAHVRHNSASIQKCTFTSNLTRAF